MIVGSLFHATRRSQAGTGPSRRFAVCDFRTGSGTAGLRAGYFGYGRAPSRRASLARVAADPETQELADIHEPLCSSLYVRGGAVEQALRGKKVSVVSWEHQQSMDQWSAKIVEAFGFPKAEAQQ